MTNNHAFTQMVTIDDKDTFESYAAQLKLPTTTFSEACRADKELRKRGYHVPNAKLHFWYATTVPSRLGVVNAG